MSAYSRRHVSSSSRLFFGSYGQREKHTATASIREAFKDHTDLAQSPIDVPFNLSKEGRSGKRRARGTCRGCGVKTSWFCKICVPQTSGSKEWYCTKASCALKHKRKVQDEACKSVPGCSGWIDAASGPSWLN